MDTFEGFVRRVVKSFNKSGLNYMLTGALAASYYGRPRTTLDVDILVAAGREDLAKLAWTLTGAGLQAEEERLRAAWKSDYKIINVQDVKSPHALDIIFTNGKLERRPGVILGLPTFYQGPEALVLAKLRMIKASRQPERALVDRGDVKAIFRSTKLHVAALRRRAQTQGTSGILEELMPH